MTMDAYYKYFVEQLKPIYDEREREIIADWVFEKIAGIKRLDRIVNKQTAINDSTFKQLKGALDQLLQNTPVQYVLGEAWFYKMRLKVNAHVLIPRPETEELVEWVVKDVRNTRYDVRSKTPLNIAHQTSDILHILDIGTGSGCIAISLKKEIPSSNLIAIDVSLVALEIAKQNAIDQHTQIDFRQMDFLDERSWPSLPSIDIIISNPPYIPEAEKSRLAKQVAEHEPQVALFVSDDDPFIFYRPIAAFAGKHLKENGKIFVEVHEDFSSEVQQIFEKENFKTEKRKDMYGRERMIKASRV